MECQKCRYWTRKYIEDDYIISTRDLWIWHKVSEDSHEPKCKICGKLFRNDGPMLKRTIDVVVDHIRSSHRDKIDELRNTHIGECSSKYFKYQDPTDVSKSNPQTLFYIDSEEYGARFYTDQEFGCKHFKERDKK